MNSLYFTYFASLCLLGTSIAQADKWNNLNDPIHFDSTFTLKLSDLPARAKLKMPPWSETYWASKKGGINIRWNQNHTLGFTYDSPSREKVARMSRDDLAKLSPTEKYDIYLGRYDYPMRKDAGRLADHDAPEWAGICDGWSIAATQYYEPKPVDMVNPDGIVIPFGSSDVKALMSFAASSIHFQVQTAAAGVRCFKKPKDKFGEDACDDINAGAMHVILANQIGIKKEAFVADVDQGPEIWNQPVFGYSFDYQGSAETETGAEGVLVHAVLYYTDELDRSQWDAVTGTSSFRQDKLEMNYILELDSSGNITGGSYVDNSKHPDFFWKAINRLTFTGEFEPLNAIYQSVPVIQ